MKPLENILVFCGSKPGKNPRFIETARLVGGLLAEKQKHIIYGGGSRGLMGAVANAALQKGGHVTGVIPETLVNKEEAHRSVQKLIVTNSMAERKEIMINMAEACIVLAGAFGTLDETFEFLSLAQLKIIGKKPCGILNTAGYYSDLIRFLDHAVDQEFLQPDVRSLLSVDTTPEGLLSQLESLFKE